MSLAKKVGITAIGLVSLLGLNGCTEGKSSAYDSAGYKRPSIEPYGMKDFKGKINEETVELKRNYEGTGHNLIIKRKDETIITYFDDNSDGLYQFGDCVTFGFIFRDANDSISIVKTGKSSEVATADMSPKDFNAVTEKYESYLKAISRMTN